MSGRSSVPRVVLDSNVCLDLLLFRDPRTALLREALAGGEVVAVTDDECRREWLQVLHYPVLRLDGERRDAMTAAYDLLVQPLAGNEAGAARGTTLPRCRDPDDQRFLQLALASGARWLLSRDRHLLSLASRCRREGWFEITTPENWVFDDRSYKGRGCQSPYNSNRYDSFTSNCSLSRRSKLSRNWSCGPTENSSNM